MILAEARQVLSSQGWLTLVPAPFRDAVLAGSKIQRFGQGESVFAQDDDSSGLWGLAEGTLGLERSGKAQSPRFAYFASPGFWIGANTLVLKTRRKLGLVALRPCVLLHLDSTAFQRIAGDQPEAWRWLAVLPLLQTEVAFSILEDLLMRNAAQRCAAFLLRLAGCRGPLASKEPHEIYVTQEQLTELVNLSRSALGEILRDFEAKGLVIRQYGRMTIDRAGLENTLKGV